MPTLPYHGIKGFLSDGFRTATRHSRREGHVRHARQFVHELENGIRQALPDDVDFGTDNGCQVVGQRSEPNRDFNAVAEAYVIEFARSFQLGPCWLNNTLVASRSAWLSPSSM
jgi:hypothetical protein